MNEINELNEINKEARDGEIKNEIRIKCTISWWHIAPHHDSFSFKTNVPNMLAGHLYKL